MKKISPTRSPLRRLVGALALSAIATVGFAACDPSPCASDCIDRVGPSRGGDKISVTTTEVANIEVTVFRDPAMTQVAGYARNFGASTYALMPVTAEYQGIMLESPTPAPLLPNKTYWYRVHAKDLNGKAWTETGSFTTKQRTLTVRITSITLIGDSDTAGAGEITFHQRVNQGAASQVYQDLNWSGSSTPRTVSITRTYTGLPHKVTLQLRAQDDDCEFSTCNAPANAWQSYRGNGDAQWATATADLTLPFTAVGSQKVNLTGGPCGNLLELCFTATLEWSVEYS